LPGLIIVTNGTNEHWSAIKNFPLLFSHHNFDVEICEHQLKFNSKILLRVVEVFRIYLNLER